MTETVEIYLMQGIQNNMNFQENTWDYSESSKVT
jgi:hypothetical protein